MYTIYETANFMKSIIQSLFRIILGVLIAIPLVLYPFLYFAQEQLLFMPPKMNNKMLNGITTKYPDVEEIQIETPDHVILHGWFVKNSAAKKSPLLIYFGGNSEEISGQIMEIDQFKEWSLLLINYRGYGLSQGKPSEKNLFSDAVLVYDSFLKRTDIDPERIVAIGRSLGTGVAVYLASQRAIKGTILITPYDSIKNLAEEIYPYVPVSWLLKHNFDSKALAPTIKVPLLALIAQNDKTIPPSHAFALIEAWGGAVHKKIIPDIDHNNITLGRGYWESVKGFLDLMLKNYSERHHI